MHESMEAETVAAAEDGELAEQAFSYCALPEAPVREFGPDVGGERMALILLMAKKWVNGTVLRYYFFDQEDDGEEVFLADGTREFRSYVGDEAHEDVVRGAFEQWKDVGIGLEFEEVDSRHEAEVRIGFMPGDGSWSFVGRDIIDLNPGVDKRTMNFGWDLTRGSDGMDTAIHEIGHTLGFPHEHQNPNAGIVWNEEAVYEALSRPPNNWSRAKAHYNIIRKISPDAVQGSSWDPDSVMHYPFGPGLIKEPEEYRNGVRPAGGLSERDREWVRTFYPQLPSRYPELKPFQLRRLEIAQGEQQNFVIQPEATRSYRIQTFGVSDSVMVLFEDIDGELRYVTGDDDSGWGYNANMRVKLYRGRRYVLRVRLYYSGGAGVTAVLMW